MSTVTLGDITYVRRPNGRWYADTQRWPLTDRDAIMLPAPAPLARALNVISDQRDEIERLRLQQTGLLRPMTIRGAIGVIWFIALILLAAAGAVTFGTERWLITFALVMLALTPIASAVDLTRRYWRRAAQTEREQS